MVPIVCDSDNYIEVEPHFMTIDSPLDGGLPCWTPHTGACDDDGFAKRDASG
jgi:hypothetical protein